jgi:hypothetical protein
MPGCYGFQYTNTYLTRPGMIDAFTILRNRLAIMPPFA